MGSFVLDHVSLHWQSFLPSQHQASLVLNHRLLEVNVDKQVVVPRLLEHLLCLHLDALERTSALLFHLRQLQLQLASAETYDFSGTNSHHIMI